MIIEEEEDSSPKGVLFAKDDVLMNEKATGRGINLLTRKCCVN
jgi:hypothetical protein